MISWAMRVCARRKSSALNTPVRKTDAAAGADEPEEKEKPPRGRHIYLLL
jgi:hypothetical protein